MALEEARNYLEEKGYGDRIQVFDTSSAAVELAALAVGTEPEKIAKTLEVLNAKAEKAQKHQAEAKAHRRNLRKGKK